MKTDIDIARGASMKPAAEIAEEIGMAHHCDPYGKYKAKLNADYYSELENKKSGKLILVTAMSPTPAGEGKTTTTVGLADGLSLLGDESMRRAARAFAGPCVRHEGRGSWRRDVAGGANGGFEPALYRRHARHNRG